MQTIDLGGFWFYSTVDRVVFSQPDYDDRDWVQMLIPQNWFLGGLDHHGVVWFRRHFDYQQTSEPQYVTLRFGGVDYFADVYLNGILLGRHAGYFEPFTFDISSAIKNGDNLLAVRVDSPFETVGIDGWHLRKRLIKGVLNHHDCRPGGGWEAEGQSYNTGGIWNRVTLIEHGELVIEQCLLQADLITDPAYLVLQMQVLNLGSDQSTIWAIECLPENFSGSAGYGASYTVNIPAGRSTQLARVPVPGVELWQPWDRGFAHLYRVKCSLGKQRLELPGKVEHATIFGFRSVRLIPSQQGTQTYTWLINGQRYFPRGSNYIASQWLSEVISPQVARSARHPFPPPGSTTAMADMPWFERDVSLAKQANLNLLRVHAHVLPPEFHDACDRAGILVWQDFALQWGYADDPGFHAEAVRQLGAMIHSLFNHPSIIAWCCHNESPWDAPWMADESGGVYDPAQNRKLDERLATVAQELDPTRYVHLNSGTGDGHVYPGWYFGRWQDYARLPAAPFPTEYGAQGLPQHTSLLQTFIQLGSDAGYADLVKFKEWLDQQPRYREKRRLLPEKSVPEELRQAYHTWRTWCFHDFQPLETFRRGRVTLGDNLDEFIASSQIYQAWILQYATETYRRHKHQPISGVIQFMFTDPWPAITWSVLDYWRLPKPAYEILRQVMQPILPCTDMLPASRANRAHFIRLFAINDKLRDYPEARLEYTVEEIGRNTVATGVLSLNLVADAVVAVGRVRLPALAPGTYRLQLSLFSAQSELLGKNEYSFVAQ